MKNRAGAMIVLLCAILATGLIAATYPTAKLEVPPSDIIFSHRLHVLELETECIACHIDIESSASAAEKNMPTMDECAACHDVEDDETCSMCHRNAEEPEAIPDPDRPIDFNHELHLGLDLACEKCHGAIAAGDESSDAFMPDKPLCMSCHNDRTASEECALCHKGQIGLIDIHPIDWRHQHGDITNAEDKWCQNCHQEQSYCVDCHRGDNNTGSIHNLNYFFTHGLDAQSKRADCSHCHDTRTFCNDCHNAANRMPLNHSRIEWITGHGRSARQNVENCASCHNNADPTCSRAGCHRDSDGLRGTDPRIHVGSGGQLDGHGPWHNDNGFFCYQCHSNTRTAGQGFCGYCHGREG